MRAINILRKRASLQRHRSPPQPGPQPRVLHCELPKGRFLKIPNFLRDNHTFDGACYPLGLLNIAHRNRSFSWETSFIYGEAQSGASGWERRVAACPPRATFWLWGRRDVLLAMGAAMPTRLSQAPAAQPNTTEELSPLSWGSDLAGPEVTGSKGRAERRDGDSPSPKHWLASLQARQHTAAQALDKPFHCSREQEQDKNQRLKSMIIAGSSVSICVNALAYLQSLTLITAPPS